MSALEKYRKILSILLPAGLFGASFLLSTTALAAVPSDTPSADDAKSDVAPVAQRLAAIRDAVSSVTGVVAMPGEPERLAYWGNGWGNGGWRNGGWGNGIVIPFVAPWGNGWNNWSNWGNGWRNWGNGWGNGGWHNWHNY